MPFKQEKKVEVIEGIVNQAYIDGRGPNDLIFDLKGMNHKLFYLNVTSARVDSRDKVRVYLMWGQERIRDKLWERSKALEILNDDGSIRFTYITDLGKQGLGEWEW